MGLNVCLSAVYRCPYSAYRRWIRSTIYNIKCGLYESCILIEFLIANRMTDSVPMVAGFLLNLVCLLNFFMDVVFIWVPKYLNFAGLSESRIPILMLWLCPAYCSQYTDIYVLFSAPISKPLSIVVSIETSLFSVLVFMISPNKFSPCNRSRCIQFYSSALHVPS